MGLRLEEAMPRNTLVSAVALLAGDAEVEAGPHLRVGGWLLRWRRRLWPRRQPAHCPALRAGRHRGLRAGACRPGAAAAGTPHVRSAWRSLSSSCGASHLVCSWSYPTPTPTPAKATVSATQRSRGCMTTAWMRWPWRCGGGRGRARSSIRLSADGPSSLHTLAGCGELRDEKTSAQGRNIRPGTCRCIATVSSPGILRLPWSSNFIEGRATIAGCNPGQYSSREVLQGVRLGSRK